MKKQNVVVPVDFSDSTDRAIETALDLVDSSSQVSLIHVLFALDSISPGTLLGNVSDESRREHVQQKFDELKARHSAADMNTVVRIGNPGLEISDFASDIGADLIVIPSHGYHGMKRLILGSVAERVIRHADCDVLVLRRNDSE